MPSVVIGRDVQPHKNFAPAIYDNAAVRLCTALKKDDCDDDDDDENKKHLKNVGPIRHCEPPHAALPFTRCRYCCTPPMSHAACASMSTTTTTRDRGDCYGPTEWTQ